MVEGMVRLMATAAGLGKVCGLVGLAVLLGGSVPPRDPDPARLLNALSGSFDTEKQFENAPLALKVVPSVGGKWLDRQHARMFRINAPAIGRDVLYLEWRSGGSNGLISRQRIWAFDSRPGGVAMRFYAFRQPQGFVGLAGGAAKFASLALEDLIAYPAECAARFAVASEIWDGRIDPKNCRIVAGSGRGMALDVTIRVGRHGFDYQEAGILDTGVKAFAVPPTVPYRFERVPKR
jgi:hypothetical protein